MRKIFDDYGRVIVVVIAVLSLIGLVVFLMQPGGVLGNAYGSITKQFVDKTEEILNPPVPKLPIYDVADLDPNITYVDFEITQENRSKIGYTDDVTDLVIPVAFYDEEDETWYKVTSIQDVGYYSAGAFYKCNNIESVVIPNSMTSIGGCAFYDCTSLASIEIPNSVTSISGFNGCTSLSSIEIPDSVTSIGRSAFSSCTSLSSIKIPDGVTKIESYAFYRCISLTSIEIPEGVTDIGRYAFFHCYNLTSIKIPASVASIGEYAFQSCDSLNVHISDLKSWCEISFSSSGHPLFEGTGNLYIDGELATTITIPAGTSGVSDYAFYACKSLVSVEIPDSVTSIGSAAFYSCTGVDSIVFKGTVAQWNAITLGSDWNLYVPATEVVCSDGVVSLS